jgi:hypothetical protein
MTAEETKALIAEVTTPNFVKSYFARRLKECASPEAQLKAQSEHLRQQTRLRRKGLLIKAEGR